MVQENGDKFYGSPTLVDTTFRLGPNAVLEGPSREDISSRSSLKQCVQLDHVHITLIITFTKDSPLKFLSHFGVTCLFIFGRSVKRVGS